MNSNIQEENGAFREFFPDPEMRIQVHFAFAFQFLPQYVAQNPYAFFSYLYRQDLPGGAMEPTRFIQSRWTLFEEKARLAPSSLETFKTGVLRSRRLTDLSMSLHEVDANAAAIIQMPAPESPGLAHFIAVVLLAPAARPEEWPRDVQARVFTLEGAQESAGLFGITGNVCEVKGGMHRTLASGIPIDPEAFLKTVSERLRKVGASALEERPVSPENLSTPGNADDDDGLSPEEAREQLGRFFGGGDGLSAANAVRIDMHRLADPTARDFMGIRLEHCWIELHLPGSRVLSQRLHHERGAVFDVITVALPSGEQREVWFEISSIFSGAASGEKSAGVGWDGSMRNWGLAAVLALVIGGLLAWSSRITSPPSVGQAGTLPVRQTMTTVVPPDTTTDQQAALGFYLRADVANARMLLRAGSVASAERGLDQVIQSFEGLMTDPSATFLCFQYPSEQRQYAESNPGAGKIVMLDWRYCEALQLRASILFLKREFGTALEVLDKAAKVAPHNPAAHNERGYVFLAQSTNFQDALKAFETARDIARQTGTSPSSEAMALRGIARASAGLGDLDNAEKALRESTLLEPGNAFSRQELDHIRQLRSKKNEPPVKP